MPKLRQIDRALSRQSLGGVVILMLVAIVASASPNLGHDGHALNTRSAELDARMVLPEVRRQSQSQRRVDEEKPDPEFARLRELVRGEGRGDGLLRCLDQCRGDLGLAALVRAGRCCLPPPEFDALAA